MPAFLDDGTMELITDVDDCGVIAATGTVHGTPVVVFCTDPTVQGGAMGISGCKAILVAYRRALADGVPVVGLWHSGGARLREGVESLHAVGEVFAIMTRVSGRIPQISVVLGPAAGGAAYGPALTDVVVLGPEGRMFVTGPDVVRSVTGEDVDMLRLGGPEPHGRRSGVVHVVADQRARTRSTTARASRRCSATTARSTPRRSPTPTSPPCCPRTASGPTTCTRWSPACSTRAPRSSCTPKWAPNVVTTLGRLGGRAVGVIANNPLRLGGCLDATSAEKAARFVRMCDAFGLPLVVVVDVPGYLPGVGQEWDGVVRRGAKLLHAFAEATVPRVTVVTRKAFGGAYIAMNSRSLGATKVFAWPDAEIAVMGAVAAVRILHRRKLADVPEDARAAGGARARRGARAHRRRRRQGRRDRRRRRGRRAGAHALGARRAIADGARGRPRRPRPPRQHPAVASTPSAPHPETRPPVLEPARIHAVETTRTVGPRPRAVGGRRSLREEGSGSGRSGHDLVQPAHGGALAGVAEDLELGVPRGAEQQAISSSSGAPDRAARAIAPRSRSSGTWMSPWTPMTRAEDAEARGDGVALALGAWRSPPRSPRTRSRPQCARFDTIRDAVPGSPVHDSSARTVPGLDRLGGPVEGHRLAQHVGERPLDVGGEGPGAGMHEDDAPGLHPCAGGRRTARRGDRPSPDLLLEGRLPQRPHENSDRAIADHDNPVRPTSTRARPTRSVTSTIT